MKKYLVNKLLAVILLLIPFANFGQAPILGTTSDFALYTSAGSLINNGASIVTGDIASYNVTPVGFSGPGTVYGTIYAVADPYLVQTFADAGVAFGNYSASGAVLGTPLETTITLSPGVCHTIGAASLNGNFTLDALGDPNAIFVININGALNIGAGSNILLANSAQFCNVYWQINGAFTLGAGAVFGGTIVSNGAITLLEGAKLYGRGITTAGNINLSNNEVIFMPAAAGTITGTSAVCQGQTGVVYSVPVIANATSYVWALPAGATITAGANTRSITVSFSAIAVGGNITVKGSNACGLGTISANYAITINPSLVASVTIAAVPSGAICAGTSVVFTATPINGASPTYQWKKNGIAILGATNVGYTTTTLTNSDAITVDMTSATTPCQTGSVSTSNSITAIVNPLPIAAGTITGTALVCQGQTGVIYTVPVITNATSYIWTLPVGATITAGANTHSITVSYSAIAVSGNYTVKGSNTCGSGTVSANYAVTVNSTLVASVTIAAVPSGAICAGTSVVFTATPINGASPTYQWKKNGIAISGATDISYTTTTLANSDAITVDMSSSATPCQIASVSTSNSITAIVNPLPIAAGTITGTATVCQGETGVIYSVPVITNATTYIWTLPVGATITAGASTRSITVSFSTIAVSGNITVKGSNTCGTGTVSANYAVTVNPLPIAAGTITGTAAICQGQTGIIYSVPVITNATTYIWTLPLGATITAGANTRSITVSFSTIAVSGNITVQGSNSCGTGTISANYAVTVNLLPVAAGTITGTASICQGQTGVIYSVPVITSATSYIWTLPLGATITAGANTHSITVSFSLSAVTGNITVQGSNTCGTGTVSANYAVTVSLLPVAAGTITGTSAVCIGETGIIYSVPVITNATTYIWTLPLGAIITAGANTHSITVSYGASAVSGNITVQGSNTCGTGTISANYAVTVNSVPLAAGTITGSATACQGYSGLTYSVPAITHATSYIWTLPVGVSIIAGANTNIITVDFSSNAVSGIITVKGSSICGLGTVSPNFAVTVNSLPGAAGIITGTSAVCVGQTGVIYSIPVISNAINYIWTLPVGATITSGANTHSITVSFGLNAVNGNIYVQGQNNCGYGLVSTIFALTVNTAPYIIAQPISQTLCTVGLSASYTVAATGTNLTYQWRKGASVLVDGGNISGANTNTLTINPVVITDAATNYNIVITGICGPEITSVDVSLIICENTGINPDNNVNTTNTVTIYPNPFTSSIAVRINDESNINKCELRVLDASGNLVLNQIITQKLTTISTNNLISGVYFYEVISENKVIQSGKLISNQ